MESATTTTRDLTEPVHRPLGRFIGENTDGKGFLRSLEEITPATGKRALIFGAGGAALAIAVEIALAGAAEITVVNRSRERGEELAAHIGGHTGTRARFEPWRGLYRLAADVDVVINATSIGLFPDVHAELPLDTGSLQPAMVVADVIPNPPRTRLLDATAARGCTVLDGRGMLVQPGCERDPLLDRSRRRPAGHARPPGGDLRLTVRRVCHGGSATVLGSEAV